MTTIYAIPTYKRPELIKRRSLSVLKESEIPEKEVFLFVSSADELKEYQYLAELGYNVVYKQDLNSLKEKNNFILDYFGAGCKIVVMEDDIRALVRKDGNKKNRFHGIKELVKDAWRAASEHETKLWGISPTDNGMFLKERIDSGLKLVAGYFYGIETTDEPFLRCHTEAKHDYERTLLHYVRYGAVIRMDYVGQQSYSFTEKGGLQEQYAQEHRIELEKQGCEYLLNRFPHLVKRNHRVNYHYKEATELLLVRQGKAAKETKDLYGLQKILDRQRGYNLG